MTGRLGRWGANGLGFGVARLIDGRRPGVWHWVEAVDVRLGRRTHRYFQSECGRVRAPAGYFDAPAAKELTDADGKHRACRACAGAMAGRMPPRAD